MAGRFDLVLLTLMAGQSANADAVDDLVRAAMADRKIPGLCLAVVDHGQVVKSAGYGLASVELNVSATPETVYQTGSVTKQFTATLVLALAEEGKLALDDPVTKHLNPSSPGWDAVTLEHLLTHTAGVPESASALIDLKRETTEGDLVRLILGRSPDFAPATRWRYSNPGYVLLGAVARKVTGKPYGDGLLERVFRPLAMTTARVIDEADLIPGRAPGYRLVGGVLKNMEWYPNTINATADSGLVMSVLDLVKWDRGLREAKVLKRASLDRMWTPVRLADGSTRPYGFGWEVVDVEGKRRVEHSGTWQGFSAQIRRDLDDDLTVIVLTNAVHGRPASLANAIASHYRPTPAR